MTKDAQISERAGEKPRADDFVEDLFGLNVRGLATIKDMFVRPATVFEAARTPNWMGRYTPSIRLLFSVITVMMVFRFIWAGEGSGFAEMMETTQLNADPDATPEDMEQLSNNYLLAYPVAAMSVFFILSLVTNIWGKGSTLVTRIRLLFLALIPNFVLTLFLMIPLSNLKGETFLIAALALAVMMMVVDFSTVFRGLAPVYAGTQRAWRGVLFAVISFLGQNLTGIAALFGGVRQILLPAFRHLPARPDSHRHDLAG